jgi:hypothetical protein
MMVVVNYVKEARLIYKKLHWVNSSLAQDTIRLEIKAVIFSAKLNRQGLKIQYRYYKDNNLGKNNNINVNGLRSFGKFHSKHRVFSHSNGLNIEGRYISNNILNLR